jgi:hypothetical protein
MPPLTRQFLIARRLIIDCPEAFSKGHLRRTDLPFQADAKALVSAELHPRRLQHRS